MRKTLRTLIAIGCGATALAFAGMAAAQAKPALQPAPTAPSAERYGVPASYRAASGGRGYSARDRHIADCLATYRGYNPRTDRVAAGPGVTRRCGL